MTDERFDGKNVTIVGGADTGRGGFVLFDSGTDVPYPTGVDLDALTEKLRKALERNFETKDRDISSGKGKNAPDGDIVFNIAHREVLRIRHDGVFLKNGTETEVKDAELPLIFRAFLSHIFWNMARQK